MAKKHLGKPPLTLVTSATTSASPPRKLGKHGLSLWNAVTSEFDVSDIGGREILAQACASQDRVEALAETIDAEGEIVRGKTGFRVHPGVKEELALRSFIVRTLQRLGINVEAVRPTVGRPGRGIGWSGE